VRMPAMGSLGVVEERWRSEEGAWREGNGRLHVTVMKERVYIGGTVLELVCRRGFPNGLNRALALQHAVLLLCRGEFGEPPCVGEFVAAVRNRASFLGERYGLSWRWAG